MTSYLSSLESDWESDGSGGCSGSDVQQRRHDNIECTCTADLSTTQSQGTEILRL